MENIYIHILLLLLLFLLKDREGDPQRTEEDYMKHLGGKN